MLIMTPEVLRTLHDDRRRQLLSQAEVRRIERHSTAARRAERNTGRSGGWLHRLTRRGVHHHDAKVTRLSASWLELDHRTARVLAGLADEVALPAGSVLEPGHFSYIGIDDAHRGLVVTTGTPTTRLESPATVLALTTGDLERIRHDVPRLASVRSRPASAHIETAMATEPPAVRRVGIGVGVGVGVSIA